MNTNNQKVGVGIGVFVFKGNKHVMLLRKSSHGNGTWCIPGGHLEFGESIEECAEREAKEETGLTIKDIKIAGITNDIFKKEDKHYITIWLTSKWKSGKARIMEPDKCSNMDWFTLENMPKNLFLPEEPNVLQSDFFQKM